MESFFDTLLPEPVQVRPPAPPPPRPLTAGDVRQKMLDILDTLNAADAMPYAADDLKRHKAMFPIMAQWLAPDDGEDLKTRFEVAIARFD